MNNIILLCLALIIIMLFTQEFLDDGRVISKHCVIRNTAIVLSTYHYFYFKNIRVFLIPVLIEIIIELIHSTGYSLDPLDNKIKNMYSFISCFWSDCMGINDDLTEGHFNNDIFKSYDNAQREKKLTLTKLSGAAKNVRILEIGFGNGKLLKYLKEAGADIHGITISREQYDRSVRMGLNVDYMNFFDMGEEYYGRYDCIICSGVIEHMPNIKTRKQPSILYDKIFDKFSKLLNPMSKIKRVVTTCIHFRDISKETSFWSKFNLYILERANGGWYPSNKDYLIDCARPYFDLLYRKDITNDYYITTYNWGQLCVRNSYKSFFPLLVNVLVNTLNNPYYLHILIEKIYSWQWQFSDENNSVIWDMITGLKKNMNVENSPTIHQLLVFKMK